MSKIITLNNVRYDARPVSQRLDFVNSVPGDGTKEVHFKLKGFDSSILYGEFRVTDTNPDLRSYSYMFKGELVHFYHSSWLATTRVRVDGTFLTDDFWIRLGGANDFGNDPIVYFDGLVLTELKEQ